MSLHPVPRPSKTPGGAQRDRGGGGVEREEWWRSVVLCARVVRGGCARARGGVGGRQGPAKNAYWSEMKKKK